MFGWSSYASRVRRAPTCPMMNTSFFSDCTSLFCRSRFFMHFTAYRWCVCLSTAAYTTEYAPDPSVSLISCVPFQPLPYIAIAEPVLRHAARRSLHRRARRRGRRA